MTSVPKKYRDRIESAEAPAVATPQATAVEPSSSAAAAKPAEQPAVETKSPVEDAALRKRLEEMNRAQELARGQPQPQPRTEPIAIEPEPQRQQPQQQPQSVEQIIQSSGLPALVQEWLRR